MNLHLAEIAAEVAPGKHAVLVVDQAGWHLSAGLVLPDNITLVVLPPKCPEAMGSDQRDLVLDDLAGRSPARAPERRRSGLA